MVLCRVYPCFEAGFAGLLQQGDGLAHRGSDLSFCDGRSGSKPYRQQSRTTYQHFTGLHLEILVLSAGRLQLRLPFAELSADE
jgi:hypothetical protein